jgi:hypothetical protein
VSPIVAMLRGEWEARSTQSLADLNVVYLCLDAVALRVRAAGRVTQAARPGRRGRPHRQDQTPREPLWHRVGRRVGGLPAGPDRSRPEGAALCIIDGNAGLHRHHARLAWLEDHPRDECDRGGSTRNSGVA